MHTNLKLDCARREGLDPDCMKTLISVILHVDTYLWSIKQLMHVQCVCAGMNPHDTKHHMSTATFVCEWTNRTPNINNRLT